MEAWYAELDALTEKHPSNLCLKHLAGEGKGYYDGLSDDLKARFAKCVASGLENADSSVGVYAMMPKDYEELAQYFDKVRPCPRPAPPRRWRASRLLVPPAAQLIRLVRREGRPGGPRPGLGPHSIWSVGISRGRPATHAQGPPRRRPPHPPGGSGPFRGSLRKEVTRREPATSPREKGTTRRTASPPRVRGPGDSLAPALPAGDATLGASLAHGGVSLDGARRSCGPM